MAVRTAEIFDRQMTPVTLKVNTLRWLVVLIGSVIVLVLLLLRRSDPSADSDGSNDRAATLNEQAAKSRWSLQRAQEWYSSQPWFLGANYLPSTSVNVLEMWQEETFDVKTIERELQWAHERLHMNALRVFLHILVWMENPAKFFQRLETFLDIAKKNNLQVMLVLFDECWNAEPKLGKQPDPVPGVHNSRWVRCPGQSMLLNKTSWPIISQYTVDVIDRYKSDRRIFAWDLYNEPECSKQVPTVIPLLRYIHTSARSIKNVEQPMTVGIAQWPLSNPLAMLELSISDVISFHSYGPLANVISNITDLQKLHPGRPILCTEWLARSFGSTLFTHLEYFRDEKVGAIHWGLIAGRSQTYYQWKSPKDAPMPKIWFHDVLFANGTAFSHFEEKFYAEVVRKKASK